MQRKLFVIFTPPLAVCRYGCASCCVAPIAVFWFASIISVIYAFFGGPLQSNSFSWGTFGLGVALWIIAGMWARTVIKGVEEDLTDTGCTGKASGICRIVSARGDEIDPLDEVRNLR